MWVPGSVLGLSSSDQFFHPPKTTTGKYHRFAVFVYSRLWGTDLWGMGL
jgi:hypothetical protein